MNTDRLVQAWEHFQAQSGGLEYPRSSEEQSQLIALLDDLTDTYDCTQEPFGSLFDFIAGYVHAWELENEPELKNPDVAPHEMLAYLMEDHGVSQYQLAREGIVDKGNLSRILAGRRSISKALAKRLAERFAVSVELFI